MPVDREQFAEKMPPDASNIQLIHRGLIATSAVVLLNRML